MLHATRVGVAVGAAADCMSSPTWGEAAAAAIGGARDTGLAQWATWAICWAAAFGGAVRYNLLNARHTQHTDMLAEAVRHQCRRVE